MPATDDEVMEVEDLIVDEQIELPVVMNTGTAECISNESTSGKPQKESSEGIDCALTKYSTFQFLESLGYHLYSCSVLCLFFSLL